MPPRHWTATRAGDPNPAVTRARLVQEGVDEPGLRLGGRDGERQVRLLAKQALQLRHRVARRRVDRRQRLLARHISG